MHNHGESSMIRLIRRKIRQYKYIVGIFVCCGILSQMMYPYAAVMRVIVPQAMLKVLCSRTAKTLLKQFSQVLHDVYVARNSSIIQGIGSLVAPEVQKELSKVIPLGNQQDLHTAYLSLPQEEKNKLTSRFFNQDMRSAYMNMPDAIKAEVAHSLDKIAVQAYHTIEAQACSADLISLTRSLTNQESPAYISLKIFPRTQAYNAFDNAAWVNQYYTNLINRFEKDGLWHVSRSPRGISIHNSNRTISLSIQGRATHSGQFLVEMCAHLAEQMAFTKHLMQTVPEFKTLVEAQTKHTLDCMVKLVSPNLSERVIALYELSGTSVAGIFGEYADNAIQSLLKGYLHSNGDINWDVIKGNNNYSQKIIKSFISKIKPHVNIDYKVYKPFLKENPTNKKYFLNMASRTGMWFKENVALSCDTDLKTYMQRHPLYQKRLDLINACKMYNFAEAKALVEQSGNDLLMQGLYGSLFSECSLKKQAEEQTVAEYNKAMFNEQGFYRACLDNPLFKKLSQSDLLAISQDPVRLASFNKGLLAQLAIKGKLMEAWRIPHDASSRVCETLYTVIQNPTALCSMPDLITMLSEHAKLDPAVMEALFLPNGVLKDFAHLSRAQTLPHAPWLFESKACDTLSLLNHLIAIESSSGSNKSILKKSSAALDRYHKSVLNKPLDDIQMDLYQAIDGIIECRKIQLSIIDWSKKQDTDTWQGDPLEASSKAVMAEIQQMFDSAIKPTTQACTAPVTIPVGADQGICPPGKTEPLPKACATGERSLSDPQGICPERPLAQEPVVDKACELTTHPEAEWECNHSKDIVPGFDEAGDVLDDIADGPIGRADKECSDEGVPVWEQESDQEIEQDENTPVSFDEQERQSEETELVGGEQTTPGYVEVSTPDGQIIRVSISQKDASSALHMASDNSKFGGGDKRYVVDKVKITTKMATSAAEKLGFKKTNYYSKGQPVFKSGGLFITIDESSHNGGFWKMANSVENLSSKSTRMGTYDKNLNRIGD
jgi:hypothetical protein